MTKYYGIVSFRLYASAMSRLTLTVAARDTSGITITNDALWDNLRILEVDGSTSTGTFSPLNSTSDVPVTGLDFGTMYNIKATAQASKVECPGKTLENWGDGNFCTGQQSKVVLYCSLKSSRVSIRNNVQ